MRTTIRGSMYWVDTPKTYEADAEGELIPGRRIELKFLSAGASYTVQLQPLSEGSPEWAGDYTVGARKQRVTAKMHTALEGSAAMVGNWFETGTDYRWFVTFDPNEDLVVETATEGG
jgi:hypothetical protein